MTAHSSTANGSDTPPGGQRIPVAGPSITEREVAAVAEAAQNAWYGNAYTYLYRFETAFADKVDRRHGCAVMSGSAAIHLALLALGIGPGDEVIVPDITWIGSAAPIVWVGAEPVFCDIDPATWCLSAASLEACLTSRTRAVVAVGLYGGLPDFNPILDLCAQHGIAVIEDAAEALGARYHGRPAGNFGVISAFSFAGNKTLTTSEGGMVVTDDELLWRRIQTLRDHGREPGAKPYFQTEIGQRYRMSDVLAALGLAQLERLDEILVDRRRIYTAYHRHLGDLPEVRLNPSLPSTENSYWLTTLQLDPSLGIDKSALIERLSVSGIDTRPFFYPLSMLPAFAGFAGADRARNLNVHAYALHDFGINLPSSATITEEQIAYVAHHIRRLVADARIGAR